MMLAIEPTISRLPASVLDERQHRAGEGLGGGRQQQHHGRHVGDDVRQHQRRREQRPGLVRARRPRAASACTRLRRSGRSASSAWLTTNRPMNRISSSQSTRPEHLASSAACGSSAAARRRSAPRHRAAESVNRNTTISATATARPLAGLPAVERRVVASRGAASAGSSLHRAPAAARLPGDAAPTVATRPEQRPARSPRGSSRRTTARAPRRSACSAGCRSASRPSRRWPRRPARAGRAPGRARARRQASASTGAMARQTTSLLNTADSAADDDDHRARAARRAERQRGDAAA